MPYSDFTLEKVKQNFQIKTIEAADIFANIPDIESSQLLKDILEYNVPIAVASNSEKARSEMIISPILLDLRRQLNDQINLFSGVEFNVDSTQGLNGICDFIITRSTERLIVTSPVIIIVEAKKENIPAGLGQCMAEMIAAKIFNEKAGSENPVIYGTVTTGSVWQFLKLEGQAIAIDLSEYYLKDVNKILGILASGIN
ncbi:MAG: hypothetical protein KME60_12375 [Cyanomargarita calcarea GSE-NOS-MK-12-04C]|jgi:hypothetical protein|uniref:Type I restriction enzyme R protein N-terminal domain-containing protein n=1 Tax=Cyanomargarita calcarea GSE-NOS-MK-12-04C TaxID=2839659 RepID=A0A951QP81_9CYAN|nr:hypothetical protein [Cyanomargarita calcarea GSE-NOS-MK-12-04C]